MMNEKEVFFSIIIPTRNRPELFKLAIDSVVTQSFKQIEVLVVNDGTEDEFLESYKQLEKEYDDNVVFKYLLQRSNGHGQSYSMNTGAYMATGRYLCFLDDDDFWTDKNHLQRAYDSIIESSKVVDAYYSNQSAFFADGTKKEGNVWIGDLAAHVKTLKGDKNDSYVVDAEFLFSSGGFGHLNCSIIRKDLYLSIKGMDENIRYECDRDIFIRIVDAADTIIYNPKVISKHHIPDPQKKDNMSTLVSVFEKRIYQINVYEKAILLSSKSCIRQHSKEGLSDIFKHITAELVLQNKFKDALSFAVKALGLKFTAKWGVYCLYLSMKRALT